jgi:hypothetical protein
MAVPTLSKTKKSHAVIPIYGGLLAFWLIIMGVMVLTYRNFNQLLKISSTEQKRQAPTPTQTAAAKFPPPASKESPPTISDNQNENLIVSVIFAANKQKYLDSLQAQAETWMSVFPKERVFAVGPANTIKGKPNFPRGVQTPCPDRELWCKRIQQIPEAFKLLQSGIHFDWMLSGNEDWYVNVPQMREALADKNPNNPVVYSTLGCGKAWEYMPESKGGTVPDPSKKPDKKRCEALREHGGSCLGDGAVFSRAAIEVMMQYGEAGLFNLTRSLPFEWETHPQDDPVLSCVVYVFGDKGVRLESKPWKAQRQYTKDGVMKIDEDTTSIHAVPREGMDAAEIIRKVHSALTHSQPRILNGID